MTTSRDFEGLFAYRKGELGLSKHCSKFPKVWTFEKKRQKFHYYGLNGIRPILKKKHYIKLFLSTLDELPKLSVFFL